jgi:hypothetical protein
LSLAITIGTHTALEGKRVALGTDPRNPVFWEKAKGDSMEGIR